MARAARSGQTAVTAAGTEVVLGTGAVNGLVYIKALTTNTGVMYIGNAGDGTVASTSGYPLAAGEFVGIQVGDLNNIMVDATVNGEKVAWLLME